ncbi:MAG: LysM peptidoglycan-binding domain-containing protein [Clostridia bacterium]|nr:LysM peptidoglycan-binding domain-containing protein [Clostridia bacterium]
MSIKGIDISSYQGDIDFNQVRDAGVECIYLRCMVKSLTADTKFEEYWQAATEAGLSIQGVYHYVYFTDVDAALKAAQAMADILGDRRPFIWLDLEDSSIQHQARGLMDNVYAFIGYMEGKGFKVGIYCNKSFYETCIKPYADDYDGPIWFARYPSSNAMSISDDAPDKDKWLIDMPNEIYAWQYSSKGTVPGISGNVDLDEVYVALETANVDDQEEEQITTLHQIGELVNLSSYYKSSTDTIDKAIIKDMYGVEIKRIKAGAPNPYCVYSGDTAMAWCNDGDIRSSSADQPSAAEVNATYHKVVSGDTVSKLAKTYGSTVADIVSWNGLADANKIYVGTTLRVA